MASHSVAGGPVGLLHHHSPQALPSKGLPTFPSSPPDSPCPDTTSQIETSTNSQAPSYHRAFAPTVPCPHTLPLLILSG